VLLVAVFLLEVLAALVFHEFLLDFGLEVLGFLCFVEFLSFVLFVIEETFFCFIPIYFILFLGFSPCPGGVFVIKVSVFDSAVIVFEDGFLEFGAREDFGGDIVDFFLFL
jgi:hypothetical protein